MRVVPTKRQWQKWTLPSKASYVGCVFGAAALVFTIGDWLWSEVTDGAPNDKSAAWVRVTDVSAVEFQSVLSSDGSIRTILPGGAVLGTVSDPQLSVFLLAKVARRRDEPPDDPKSEFWRVSEAVVDASGNWEGIVCGYRHLRSSSRPYFEYWEFMAVAITAPAQFLDLIPDATCSITTETLWSIETAACSSTRILMRPPDDGVGAYLGDVRPLSRMLCGEGNTPPNKAMQTDAASRRR